MTGPLPAMTYTISPWRSEDPAAAPVLVVEIHGQASIDLARSMFEAVAQEAQRFGPSPILWDFREASYDDLPIVDMLTVAAAFPATLRKLATRGALLVRRDRGAELAATWKQISRITLDLEREVFHDRDEALAWACAKVPVVPD